MQAPNAEQIEMAADNLNSVPQFIQESQLKELNSFGDHRAKLIGASGLSVDFQKGYQLGLRVARVVISQSMAVVLAKIPPEDIL
jgi:hypothetical protein